jgi:hypothetical protein
MGFLVWQPSAAARERSMGRGRGGQRAGTVPGLPLGLGSSTAMNWRVSVANVD